MAFAPSMFFGNNPANFYTANGRGSTATVSGFTIIWVLASGIALLTSASPKAVLAGNNSHTAASQLID
ncbi:hypothetical protein [Nocardia africana]|uniref:hypothetical protein n=1 Tax=Nocardia africana TaxID=134964 RepID=UPI000FE18371|nr:hypothetical protein [Nocardia africana]MCC3311888.1 hypothetical protein [Nocardia africana]